MFGRCDRAAGGIDHHLKPLWNLELERAYPAVEEAEMMDSAQWSRGLLGGAASGGLLFAAVAAALLVGASVAHSGPCTAQIAALEQQVGASPPGPKSGPTFSQTLGAQLHYQPTPRDVEHAEQVANTRARAALDRARQADAAGDAAGCNAALIEAKRLYDIGQ